MSLSSLVSVPESTWWRSKSCRRGPLAFSRAGHPTLKCCSSSTCPVLHGLHTLSSTGRPMNLPVPICSGTVPPLSYACRDLWDFTLSFCTYSSVLEFMYFGLDKTCLTPLLFKVEETAGDYMLEFTMWEPITGASVPPGLQTGHTQLKSAWLDLPSHLDFDDMVFYPYGLC